MLKLRLGRTGRGEVLHSRRRMGDLANCQLSRTSGFPHTAPTSGV